MTACEIVDTWDDGDRSGWHTVDDANLDRVIDAFREMYSFVEMASRQFYDRLWLREFATSLLTKINEHQE